MVPDQAGGHAGSEAGGQDAGSVDETEEAGRSARRSGRDGGDAVHAVVVSGEEAEQADERVSGKRRRGLGAVWLNSTKLGEGSLCLSWY